MTGQSLRQDLKTSLKLTASLTQSIKALQLSSMELEEYVTEQLLDNPFLIKEEVETVSVDEKKYLVDKKISTRRYEFVDYDHIANIESQKNLKDHLRSQISQIIFDNKAQFIANYITDLLDENGYLQTSCSDIAHFLKIDDQYVEAIISTLQTLDPAGVYARNLSECIKIQIIDKEQFDDVYDKILNNLEMVAKREFSKLAKICKITIENLTIYLEKIKKLEPKPGRNYSYELVSVKIADVKISISPLNEIIITSNKEIMPSITINKVYYDQIKNKLNKEADKSYAIEKLKNAQDLVKSVEMRTKTIILVAQAIAAEQEEFLRRGILYLKPMTLSKIAEMTGHNESTISRATSNKYIETPFGVIEMKYFFSSGVKSKYSKEEVSSHKVKELIKTLINDEDKSRPLCDDEIAIMLKQFNVIAARRTVAKYREAINISSSSRRKRNAFSLEKYPALV